MYVTDNGKHINPFLEQAGQSKLALSNKYLPKITRMSNLNDRKRHTFRAKQYLIAKILQERQNIRGLLCGTQMSLPLLLLRQTIWLEWKPLTKDLRDI
jgi:hypothetical protein